MQIVRNFREQPRNFFKLATILTGPVACARYYERIFALAAQAWKFCSHITFNSRFYARFGSRPAWHRVARDRLITPNAAEHQPVPAAQ